MRHLAIIAALAALTTPALAHDFSQDLTCFVSKPDGSKVFWTFAPNSGSTDGAPVATFVETGYQGGGKQVFSQAGARPVWIVTKTASGDIDMIPRATPDYMLREDTQGVATLLHRGVILGAGRCSYHPRPTAGTIGDVAPE
jgi:hypothetical protein